MTVNKLLHRNSFSETDDKTLPPLNKERVLEFSYKLGDLSFDFSKTNVDRALLDSYLSRAEEHHFEDKRRKLFEGFPINTTENRSVLHTLLRSSKTDCFDLYNKDDAVHASDSQKIFLHKVDDIRKEFFHKKQPIKNIIHIGIGGSSLGPQLVYEALVAPEEPIKVHFVDNIDAHQILEALGQCEPKSTLVFGVSKTFTTQETLVNIDTVKQWFIEKGDTDFYERFFVVTANKENVDRKKINESRVVTFPNWVGGRYSVWSSVSLSVALVLGRDSFVEFLKGAELIDCQLRALPIKDNPIFVASALDHFYSNSIGASSKAIFAYDYRLRTLVSYLQQLEMESNGKDRDILGNPVGVKTSSIVWGGAGTSMQHSTFQLLHQGTHDVPVEFILVKKPAHELVHHHRKLIANGLAQSAALFVGRTYDEVSGLLENKGLSEGIKKSKVFAGDKPSTTIVIPELTPKSLGQLLSFYEHRVFCGGVLANINSFDQMGVELGKQLANSIEPFLLNENGLSEKTEILDASTMQLISQLRQH